MHLVKLTIGYSTAKNGTHKVATDQLSCLPTRLMQCMVLWNTTHTLTSALLPGPVQFLCGESLGTRLHWHGTADLPTRGLSGWFEVQRRAQMWRHCLPQRWNTVREANCHGNKRDKMSDFVETTQANTQSSCPSLVSRLCHMTKC